MKFLMFNMILHFKFIYNLENYKCDSPNSPLNCAFTLLSSNVNVDNHNVDNQCVHVELQVPNL